MKPLGLMLALGVAYAAAWSCVEPYDLVGPTEPGYAELCMIGIAPGDTVQLRREAFERCDPGPHIFVVTFR